MKKYFVISDVHSYYTLMMSALEKAGFEKDNPEHIIISCGDCCDRGDESKEVLELLCDLHDQGRAILVLGNHEDLMGEAIVRGYFKTHDIHNRTTKTACQLTGIEDPDEALQQMQSNELWDRYIEKCVDYYETDHYVFVHGWIPVNHEYDEGQEDYPEYYRTTHKVYNPDWRHVIWGDDWSEARWLNGMLCWHEGVKEPGKTIVCGHYHASYGNAYYHHDGEEFLGDYETFYIDPETGKQEPHVNFGPFIDDGIVAIDACTALSKQVNIFVIEGDNI